MYVHVYSSVTVYVCIFRSACVYMRFSTSVLSSVVCGVSGTELVCSEEIVSAVATSGFTIDIYNCLTDTYSVGVQACLSAYIAANEGLIPDGSCRDAYQTLVNAWANTFSSTWSTCASETITELPGLDCLESIDLVGGMDAFYVSTGFYPTMPMCSAAQVRMYARNGALSTILNYKYDETSDTPWVGDGVACDFCYEYLFDQGLIDLSSGGNSSLIDECIDGPSDVCLEAGFMLESRAAFAACAGWDILFEGPVCTADNVETVQALIPKPYYTFANCAYNPTDDMCAVIQSFVDQIELETADSTNCLACYTELEVAIQDLADYDTDYVCVDSGIYSEDCLGYLNSALADFETCSGSTLDVEPPTTTTETPTTTTTTTTTTTEATTSTEAATTKATSFTATLSVVTFALITLAL